MKMVHLLLPSNPFRRPEGSTPPRRGLSRGMRTTVLGLAAFLCAAGARSEVQVYGYLGVANENHNLISEITGQDIPFNTASVTFPENWTTVQLGPILSSFQSEGVKAQLWLDNVLFKRFSAASSACGAPGAYFKYRLRADWQQRLANFMSTNGAHITSAKVGSWVVFPEVNNGCVSFDDINAAALQLKSYRPTLPTVIGYGYDKDVGVTAPAAIPQSIDWVGFWDYGYFNPAQTACPNPPQPPCPSAGRPSPCKATFYLERLEDLKSKLAAHQRILLVPDAFWQTGIHGSLPECQSDQPVGTGWPQWYLSPVAANYAALAQSEAKVIGVLYWLWSTPPFPNAKGTRDLPTSVRTRHRTLGCTYLGGC
ncbi:MAG: hypothetical protein KDD47_27940 [Acidobacteria bacterium]|nr:hypothetical protein [Acidobacteriota bacterium]